jgi:uracil-DNA glycosylase
VAATPFDLLRDEALGCMKCRLADGRTQVVFGSGDPGAALVLVGEAPGANEDLAGRPFVGRSGNLLDRLVAEETGLDRSELYITNVVKCRPEGNRDPRADEVAACRPYLFRQLEQIRPAVVVTLGNFASKLLLETAEGITRLRGRVHPFPGGGNRPVVVPTFHPAAALRGGARVEAELRSDLRLAASVLAGAGPSVSGVAEPTA